MPAAACDRSLLWLVVSVVSGVVIGFAVPEPAHEAVTRPPGGGCPGFSAGPTSCAGAFPFGRRSYSTTSGKAPQACPSIFSS